MRLTIAASRNPLTDTIATPGFDTGGLEVDFVTRPVMQIFADALSGEPVDVVEFSLANHVMAVGAGDARYVGLPVFTFRGFRHSMIWVREDSQISRPEDLKGKRVGIAAYALTALVWVRGLLADEYGVQPEDVEWLRTGRERIDFPPPPGVTIRDAPGEGSLFARLRDGDFDAIVTFWSSEVSAGGVRRLFPDVAMVEADYYRRSGIYPIMHCFALSRRLHEENPGLAERLMALFQRAKQDWQDTVATFGGESIAITPWTPLDLERSRAILGADLYPYGIAANRATLEAVARYTREQHLAPRDVNVEEIFLPIAPHA